MTDALDQAGFKKSDLDAVAVTQGPGLVGSLLVGYSFAKALAYGLDIPWVGVNHLEGHILSVFLEDDPPDFPFCALLASGGHTAIYYVTAFTEIERMGQTRDDAAGEAYDKVAKVLGLGYPGGKVIDDLAHQGDPTRIPFKRPFLDRNGFDFSFSGIKSAVSRLVQKEPETIKARVADVAAGFQEAVVEVLTFKLMHAVREKNCRHAVVAGGVAANRRLRESVRQAGREQGVGGLVSGSLARRLGPGAVRDLLAGELRLGSGIVIA